MKKIWGSEFLPINYMRTMREDTTTSSRDKMILLMIFKTLDWRCRYMGKWTIREEFDPAAGVQKVGLGFTFEGKIYNPMSVIPQVNSNQSLIDAILDIVRQVDEILCPSEFLMQVA